MASDARKVPELVYYDGIGDICPDAEGRRYSVGQNGAEIARVLAISGRGEVLQHRLPDAIYAAAEGPEQSAPAYDERQPGEIESASREGGAKLAFAKRQLAEYRTESGGYFARNRRIIVEQLGPILIDRDFRGGRARVYDEDAPRHDYDYTIDRTSNKRKEQRLKGCFGI
jgi:hypothetical protein